MRLGKEIESFAKRVPASQYEVAVVIDLVQEVNRVVKQLWPGCEAVLVGSHSTGLDLPGSSLDIVVTGTDESA